MKYTYDAAVERVVDGDTVICKVDLGFGIWLCGQSFRLIGINAREKSQAGGPEARANLESLLPFVDVVHGSGRSRPRRDGFRAGSGPGRSPSCLDEQTTPEPTPSVDDLVAQAQRIKPLEVFRLLPSGREMAAS